MAIGFSDHCREQDLGFGVFGQFGGHSQSETSGLHQDDAIATAAVSNLLYII